MKYFFMVLLMSQSLHASDHFDGSTYFNPWGVNNEKTLLDVLSWKLKGTAAEWPEKVATPQYPLPNPTQDTITVTWVNHSTFLIQTDSLNILTDPIWAERCSPVSFAGPKRVVDPGISFEKLPKIDLVLVSHNHYDHLDSETLKRLSDQHAPLILVPLGDKAWLESAGVKNLEELDWYQTRTLGDFKLTFLPAQHWSARGMFDRNQSLWGSWGIEYSVFRLYHAGDTGLGPHFKEIRQKWGKPDVAMIPVGAYEPRWFMKGMHMNPSDALEACKILQATHGLGMHLETFQLTDEAREEPRREFLKIRPTDLQDKFEILQIGESRIFKRP